MFTVVARSRRFLETETLEKLVRRPVDGVGVCVADGTCEWVWDYRHKAAAKRCIRNLRNCKTIRTELLEIGG